MSTEERVPPVLNVERILNLYRNRKVDEGMIERLKKELESEEEYESKSEGSYVPQRLFKLPKKIRFCELILEYGLEAYEYSPGVYTVYSPSRWPFEYSPSTGKWNSGGKNKWYKSKSPEDFIEKYVLKPKKEYNNA